MKHNITLNSRCGNAIFDKKKLIIYSIFISALTGQYISYFTGKTGFSAMPIVRAFMYSVSLAILFIDLQYLYRKVIRIMLINKFSLIFIIYLLAGTYIALSRGGVDFYYISDMAYLICNFFLAYWGSKFKSQIFDNNSLFKLTALVVGLIVAARIADLGVLLFYFIFLSSYVVYIYFSGNIKLIHCILFFPFYLGIENINRAFVMAFLLTIVIVAFKSGRIRKLFGFRSSFFFIVIVFAIAVLSTDESSTVSRRINDTYQILESGSLDITTSTKQRLYEAELVKRSMLDANLLEWCFGMGIGASLNMSNSEDSSVLNSHIFGSTGKIHNIHLLPYALIYRFGIFGFVVACIIVVKIFSKNIRVSDGVTIDLFVLTYLMLQFINSFFASSYLFSDPLFFLFFGYLIGKRKLHD